MAQATLRLKDAADAIKTHDLIIENLENRNAQLPLFGHFCCRLAVQPDCQNIERISGYLKIKEVTARATKIESVYWASLSNFQLKLWTKRSDRNSNYGGHKKSIDNQTPDLVIPITKKTVMKSGSNALTLHNEDKCFLVSNDDGLGDIRLWVNHLDQCIKDYAIWEPVADFPMEIPSPSPTRAPMFMKPRAPGSLYDETPIQGLV